MSSNKGEKKRLNLELSPELYEDIRRTADRHNTTMAGMIRRFVKLGLAAAELDNNPDAALLFKNGDEVHEVKFY